MITRGEDQPLLQLNGDTFLGSVCFFLFYYTIHVDDLMKSKCKFKKKLLKSAGFASVIQRINFACAAPM